MERLISHGEVTTVMGLLAEIAADVKRIRILLEDENGEEEEEEREPDA